MKILGMSLLAAWIIIACNTASNTQISATTSKPAQPSIDVQEVLSWLPADTETVTVANGSFLLPNVYTEKEETQNRELSDQDLAQNFESLPAALLGLNNGLLVKHLKGKRVSLAIEGARHFRAPAALGGMPFEGCAITIFAGDLGDTGDSFIKGTQKVALRVEEIEGQKVAAFQEKLEQDLWTSFVAFPSRNVVLVATNRNYIREVLARLHGKTGARALPDSLPEWRHVNTRAPFWGLRHFDRSQGSADPSSPFGGPNPAIPDEKAIGLTFNFDPGKGRSATITYLSGDKDIVAKMRSSFLAMGTEPQAEDLHVKFRKVEPGVVEGSYNLEHSGPVQYFFFVLEAMLGHAVYL